MGRQEDVPADPTAEAVHDVRVSTNQSHGTAITIPVAVTGIDADEVVTLRVLDTLHRQILSEIEAVHDVRVSTNQSHGTAITIPVAVTGIDADEVVTLRVLDTLHRQILSEVRLEEILYGLQVLKFAHGVLVLSG